MKGSKYGIIKYITTLLLLCLAVAPLSAQRKKVGVVLSGGGAKGAAHIGALKVIEEACIPIDYITGTSMGAIIGGLYAIGYSPEVLDSLVKSQNWTELLGDRISRRNLSFEEKEASEKYLITLPLSSGRRLEMPSGLVGGYNVYNLLKELCIGYHDSISFHELPIPFSCVAYDLASGNTVELNSGNLPLAIRASMSIPGAFQPVYMDSMVLIDGGIKNNFPVDIIKDMGADVVIGIDVAAGAKDVGDIKNLGDMFNQITWFIGLDSYEGNVSNTDVYIHPDIKGYNAGSFSTEAMDTLIRRGEEAARGKWDELAALREIIGLPEDYEAERCPVVHMDEPVLIRHIYFEGLTSEKEKSLRRVAGLREYSMLTPQMIHDAVAKLQGMGTLREVSFRLEGPPPYDLVFDVKYNPPNSISLGIRFDTEEMAAMLLNVSLAVGQMTNSHFDVTGRLSENIYIKGAFVAGNDTERKYGLSYMFRYNNLDFYNYGNRLSNMDFGYHVVDAGYSNIQVRNFKVGAGVRYEYYDYRTMLTAGELDIDVRSEGLFSYYLNAQFESFDRRYNPTRGLSFTADYSLYTSDFVTYNGYTPFSAIHMDLLGAIPVSRRVAFLPGVFGRVIIGDEAAFPTLNFMGGNIAGRYMPQQIPFVGIRRFEMFDNAVMGAKLDFRVRLWQRNFVSLKMNYAKQDDDFFKLHKGSDIWGLGLAYRYMTLIGPIDLQIDYSNRSKKLGAYFNLGYYF